MNTQLQSWNLPEKGMPRRAAISAFGFSGTNAHIVIEEAPSLNRQTADWDCYPIVLSAQTQDQLRQQIENLRDHLIESEILCGDMSFTLLIGRKHFNHRWGCLVSDLVMLRDVMNMWLETGKAEGVFVADLESEPVKLQSTLMSDGNACIEQFIADRSAEDLTILLALYLKGYVLDYARLFVDSGFQRISLPTYPFLSGKYWVANVQDKSDSQVVSSLGYTNISNFKKQCYLTVLHGDENFLVDHVIKNKKVLPATVYLEIVREVAARSFDLEAEQQKIIILRNIVWIKPIVSEEGASEIYTTLLPHAEGYVEFEVNTLHGGNDCAHCKGIVGIVVNDTSQIMDLSNLIHRCSKQLMMADEMYQYFREVGIEYGPAHRCLTEVYYGDEDSSRPLILAKLVLSEVNVDTLQAFMIHPCLLDAALQSVLGLLKLSGKIFAVMPFTVESVELYQPFTKTMWAITQYSDAQLQDDSLLKVNITVCDEQGNICVRLINLVFKILMPEAHADEKILIAQPIWQESKISPQSLVRLRGDNVVIIFGNVHQVPGMEIVCFERKNVSHGQQYYFWSLLLLGKLRELIQTHKSADDIFIQVIVPFVEQQVSYVGLAGMLVTAILENPNMKWQLIEIDVMCSSERIAEVLRENSCQDINTKIKYENGKRWVHAWMPVINQCRAVNVPWRDHGVYLITGGAGSLGMIFAKDIAEKTKHTTIILVGRSVLSHAQEEQIAALTSFGVSIMYKKVEIHDRGAVNMLVEDVCQHQGAINGIIHAAGVIKDSFILQKTKEELEQVFTAKVFGLENIDQTTQNLPLDFFIIFSSTTAELGNIGQADYAAANAYMDSFAYYRGELVKQNQRFGKTLSINWPLWQEGNMQPTVYALDDLYRRLGMLAMGSQQGLQVVYYGLSLAAPQVLVLFGKTAVLSEKLFQSTSIQLTENSPDIRALSTSSNSEIKQDVRREEAIAIVKNVHLSKQISLDPTSNISPDESIH